MSWEQAEPVGSVTLIGAGGHALACAEVLRAAGWRVAGCLSEDGAAHAPLHRIGLAAIGSIDDWLAPGRSGESVFVAVGEGRARRRLAEQASGAGAVIVTAVSPAANMSPSVVVGVGALVMPGAVINACVSIGDGAIVNSGAVVEHEGVVGAFSHIAPGAVLAGNVTIDEGAFVGAGAVVLPGRRIGPWAVVGAGGVVTTDVAAGVTVVGLPARVPR